MHKVYLLLGSNLGNRGKNIDNAINELKACGLIISKKSSLYNTSPWGYTEQPEFLNQALECFTSFEPLELLKEIKKIEKKMGREKTVRYGPRIIDIDIIFYDDLIFKSDELTIPHPLMHERDFVLKPLCEIASDFVHPELKISVRKLLEKL
ncbi:2-amino-4-hydroxy-6-hydroxymethyldihydropteridine diphosphokinase [Thermodesulfovibrio yellowstonii]|uniref:2-amino-4-hydroxy-6-hydroxymethyldihydropteridine pyrophosphokinase n=1 Tax=Thermodesulfovibrio yellowstonii TaxID=28262 RepID=A0A9W6LKF8_9BACT|nr:2-amino-4-hydroxy-6-hydroxymethyldihydropteridine diphosphokinase [Thermodesulfovibrio islandicus]GLI53569.1 2-amino-4-hydroxy-6-hydroxymethyldihydropteridine diphosphokinase [Thermodesulfovibrio islandicus]